MLYYSLLTYICCRDALSSDSPKIEGIEGNRIGQVFPTSSRVRSGFGGLSCRRSGWSERGPLMIGDYAFLKIFLKIISPDGADSPFQTYRMDGRTDEKVN